MSESFKNVPKNLLFVKNSLIQFVSSGKPNVLPLGILIGISSADTLSECKLFTTFLTVASGTCWKENLLLSLNLSLILRIVVWFEKLSMIPWTLSSQTLTFEDQLNKLSESVTVSKNVFAILFLQSCNYFQSKTRHFHLSLFVMGEDKFYPAKIFLLILKSYGRSSACSDFSVNQI